MTDQLEDKLEWVALAMAIFLLGLACYRLLLTKWRSDIDLRSYPFLRPLESRVLRTVTTLELELAGDQPIELLLLNEHEEPIDTIHKGELNEGVHRLDLDTTRFADGMYFIRLRSRGQLDTKRIEIRNS